MTQAWNPSQFGAQAPAPAFNAPVGTNAAPAVAPGAYVPPVQAAPATQAAAAPYAPQGAPPQGYGGPAFQMLPPSLDQKEPDLPPGDHLLVATGNVGIVASGKLLQVEFLVERSTNPDAVEKKGFWKCWMVRNFKGAQQAISNDIGRLVVPLSGRDKALTDANTALQLGGEFANRFTLEGQPIAGRRVGAHIEHKSGPKKDGSGMSSWVEYAFHALPAGT